MQFPLIQLRKIKCFPDFLQSFLVALREKLENQVNQCNNNYRNNDNPERRELHQRHPLRTCGSGFLFGMKISRTSHFHSLSSSIATPVETTKTIMTLSR